jgi:putative tryptophan/tyrosine transport system substrate-binding protein
MKRREFITLLGGAAAAWPLAARAQQPTMPVIGFLDIRSPNTMMEERLRAFHQGLKDTGYVERENVAIEYRWAENQVERLPELAAEVRRQVAALVTIGGPAGLLAAKAATTTIPIVFAVAEDPVRLGFVGSLARPGGNLTGINLFTIELAAKRLELLRALVPRAARMAVLVTADNAETTVRDVEAAARALGLQIQVFKVSAIREIDAAFATFARERPDALFVAGDAFLSGRRVQLAQLAAFHRLPATYELRDYAEAGGLMSYGPSISDAFRQIGVYTGRILKGAKPADLPVVQSSKFELVINAGTARMLGLPVPDKLLVAADEVIRVIVAALKTISQKLPLPAGWLQPLRCFPSAWGSHEAARTWFAHRCGRDPARCARPAARPHAAHRARSRAQLQTIRRIKRGEYARAMAADQGRGRTVRALPRSLHSRPLGAFACRRRSSGSGRARVGCCLRDRCCDSRCRGTCRSHWTHRWCRSKSWNDRSRAIAPSTDWCINRMA